jgi:hypothetical protein
MTKPIPDKAEVAVEYPDKLYIGTFEQTSRFDAHLDEAGIALSLHRLGPGRRAQIRAHAFPLRTVRRNHAGLGQDRIRSAARR